MELCGSEEEDKPGFKSVFVSVVFGFVDSKHKELTSTDFESHSPNENLNEPNT